MELDGRLVLERRLAVRRAAIDSAASRSVPIGRASWRAAIPLNQNAAKAPTAVANSTRMLKSRRRRPSGSSSSRAGAAITTDAIPGALNAR